MRYCYVTNELYPRDKGGIGRLLHNIVQHQAQTTPDPQISIILPHRNPADAQALRTAFEGVANLFFARPWSSQRWTFAPANAAQTLAPIAESLNEALGIIDTILAAEATQKAPFDVIEIPDHGGLGAYLLRARGAGQAFESAHIICRLHSSFSIIAAHEPFQHARGNWAANRLDLERETVAESDLCVAHLDAIIGANQQHFGLPESWREKTLVQFPPVIWPAAPHARPAITDRPTEFIFTSRFQAFKRPELFVRGALAFIANDPDRLARFRLISYGFDPLYIDRIRLMIPPDYRARISVETGVDAATRDRAIMGGIVVQPSSYESLCVLAYEAGALGRPVLLARDCAAFGAEPRWRDGENCLMFNPDPESLAAAMAKALDWHPAETVDTRPAAPIALRLTPRTTAPNLPAALFVFAVPGPDGLQDYSKYGEIITVTAMLAADQFMMDTADNVKIHHTPPHQFAGQAVVAQARDSGADCVILCCHGTVPDPAFIDYAQRVVRPGRCFSTTARVPSGKELRLVGYAGAGAHLSLGAASPCPPCLAVHIDDLPKLVDPLDDQDIVDRALARLQTGMINLVLGPVPLIEIHKTTSPDRKLRGYGQTFHSITKLGLELAGGGNTATLRSHAPTLRWLDDAAPPFQAGAHPAAYRLALDPSPHRFIIGANVQIDAQATGSVRLSLHLGHNSSESIAAHQKDLHVRKIDAGKQFQMRWGPYEGGVTNLTLVVQGDADLPIEITELLRLTRE